MKSEAEVRARLETAWRRYKFLKESITPLAKLALFEAVALAWVLDEELPREEVEDESATNQEEV